MAKAIGILTVPFDEHQGIFQDDEFQKFLLNKQVKSVRPEFFCLHGRAYWTMYMEYEATLTNGDGERLEGLNGPERLLLQRLKEWRRSTAERDGLPVFFIATNRQLLDLVKQAPQSLEALRDIRGFGKKKLARYGQTIIDMMRAFYEKTPLKEENPS